MPLAPTRFGRFADAVIVRVNRLNMTNTRQLVTYGVFAATSAVYLALSIKYALVKEAKEWTPAEIWLGFLALMSGLDWNQFRTKRTTDQDYMVEKTKQASAPSSITTTVNAPPATVTTETKT